MIIDVSSFQGNIDWAKVKASGVEGAIIRCGWGMDFKNQDDAKFQQNVVGCIKNGVPFGVYLYSYARVNSAAESEARHIMRLCDPYKDKMTLPVFYDLEENGTQSGAVERARVWAKILTDNGYKVGIYANSNWWKNYLKGLDEFPKWVANYGSNDGKPHTKPSNSGMVLWQYTSRGFVSGISGNVDCNLSYFNNIVVPTPQVPVNTDNSKEEYNMPTIKRGSKGTPVKIWQVIVGTTPDGDFGPATEKATKTYQKAHRLTADGIVGPKTWKVALNSFK